MSKVIIGQWGKNLAVRFPFEFAETLSLGEGEQVELEAQGMDIIIHRPKAYTRADAQAAAEEIIAESNNYLLDEATIQALLQEGRRK